MGVKMQVKFYDLAAQYHSIKREIDEAVLAVMEQAAFYDSPFVQAFEDGFSKKHQAKHCVAVNSGTSALHATLLALEIGPGDEVIVPANTFFATAEAVTLAGATPVFIDCKSEDYCIDPKLLQGKLSSRTKAIIPVHMYGQSADLDELKQFADRHGLFLIEDCAHAHLATYKQRPIGTFGEVACFSFFPGKNLGAYGEGGAILTNNTALAVELQKIRFHGATRKYHHERIGHHYRMEGFQGAILNVKLKYIEEWTAARRRNADLYHQLLRDCRWVVLPRESPANLHVYHLYVIRCQNRDALKAYLEEKGIETGLHYPVPLHLQQAYFFLNYAKGDFPVAEKLSLEILSLPISEQLKEEEVKYVCHCIKKFYKGVKDLP